MYFYEARIVYQRQTGEENPGKVSENYLIESINPTDCETQLMEHVQPMVFGNESKVTSVTERKFYDIFPGTDKEAWYKGGVELIVMDGEKEKRQKVAILVEANDVKDAHNILSKNLSGLDNEIVSIAKTKIVEVIRASREADENSN